MKIVITGSTGSIGKKVCEILAGQKKEIISFSKSVGLSVENRPQVKEVFKNSDYVIHMAAEKRGSTISKIVEYFSINMGINKINGAKIYTNFKIELDINE